MIIARHHAEWLSLLEISGPFLSMPVLLNAFPQGLEAHDPEHVRELRAAYEEWADNQGGLQPDPAIHHAWIQYVLRNTLELPNEVLAEGQAIPDSIKTTLPEYGELLRPSHLIKTLNNKPLLLIQVLPAAQSLEKPIPKQPWKASPATRMMTLLHATEIRLGLVTNGEQWLLVDALRGETTGFISWYASLWLEESLTLRAFRSLLGADRFFNVPDEQTLMALLAASAKDQHEVTDQLGYQVRQAVEILIQAVDKADQDRGRALVADMQPERLYEAALTVMMRLVFLLTAEERGLLLLGDPIYDQYYAISTLRTQLREMADRHGEEVLERRFDAWSRLLATFRVVYGGIAHENLKLPAYGGSLFDPDRFPFLEGRPANTHWYTSQAQPLPINNRTVLHLLEALQMLQVKIPGSGGGEARRLSFRALDIEQIGHVYEGLLDHVAIRATEPVLGLQGTKDKEPEIPISELEAQQANGQTTLIKYLREQTGRTLNALENGLNAEVDVYRAGRLRRASGNDEAIYQRILSFAGLVRDDDYGVPVVVPVGSIYVTAGPTRRATGTHYTPSSLTEPIVKHTLEPLVYIGPAEGKPREDWLLRSPAELLDLKICDMAMGSGAFLVQVCRYLSERLVEAWEVAQTNLQSSRPPGNGRPHLQITPEGNPATGDPGETLIPQDEGERLTLARRLVVDRCLYGVDKNHLAVEMAKLSLWLITLDKNRPFTFLDHALKHGDSIVGADEDMFLRWAHGLRDASMPLFDQENRRLVEEARVKRQALQAFEVRDVRDAERKAQLLAEAETATERIKLGCDLLVGVRLLDDLNQSEQDALLANALIEYTSGKSFSDPTAQRAIKTAQKLPAFHWPFEFPEVFANGGFSAFVSNPPFIGGQRISGEFGTGYLQHLKSQWDHMKGSADYSAYFFLRGFANLRQNGSLGLVATNTIAQGTTRELGLAHITRHGGEIYYATNNQPWPGSAAVAVNVVHIYRGRFAGESVLDSRHVERITSFLNDMPVLGSPQRLMANSNLSFQGSNILGMGFTMSPEEGQTLLTENPKNKDVLFPFLNGQDLNGNFDQSPSRWVINFFEWPLQRGESSGWLDATDKKRNEWLRKGIVPSDYPEPVANDYPDCMTIVRERVYPVRRKNRNRQRREIWWRFTRPTIELYQAIDPLSRVLVVALTSKYLSFTFVSPNWVYAHACGVIAFETSDKFAVLQSSYHDAWARTHGSTLETRLRYTPADVFETFPFPSDTSGLGVIGENYHEHRRQLMLEQQEGLTKTYNRFHDPDESAADIAKLRQLHVEMDNVVAAAYGWDDLDLGHGFHETAQGIRYTISENGRREVLTRLLKLNHERYAEEVRLGLHEKKTKRKSSKSKKAQPKKNDGQMSLF
jgi:hypothetical protein